MNYIFLSKIDVLRCSEKSPRFTIGLGGGFAKLNNFDKSFKQFSLISTVSVTHSWMSKTVLFQTNQLNISTQFFVYAQLNGETVNSKQFSLA